MKLKRILPIVIVLLFVSLIAVYSVVMHNSAVNTTAEITIEDKQISYSTDKQTIFDGKQKLYDSCETANIIDIATVSIDSEISISFSKKPTAVYEYDFDTTKKLEYDKDTNSFIMEQTPASDSENWFSVIAYYGFERYVYTFCVYNNDVETENDIDFSYLYEESTLNDLFSAKDISVRTTYSNYTYSNNHFGYTVENISDETIKTNGFRLERKYNGKWYDVTEKELFTDEMKQKFESAKKSIYSKSKETVCEDIDLISFFDIRSSGIFRIVVPYTKNDTTFYAVSNTFSIGYVNP